jgi:hypothetical protein
MLLSSCSSLISFNYCESLCVELLLQLGISAYRMDDACMMTVAMIMMKMVITMYFFNSQGQVKYSRLPGGSASCKARNERKKKTPWSESACELYRPSDRRLSVIANLCG